MATFFLCCYWKFKPPHCLWLRYLWHVYATYIFLIESTGSGDAFVANMKVTTRHPQSFLTLNYYMRKWMYNSGTLQQQQTMLFSYQAVSSGRNSRPNLCQHKVSEWHICISKPITKTLWTLFGYLCVSKLIFSEGTLQHFLFLLFNICLVWINFNNSGFTYKRCAK